LFVNFSPLFHEEPKKFYFSLVLCIEKAERVGGVALKAMVPVGISLDRGIFPAGYLVVLKGLRRAKRPQPRFSEIPLLGNSVLSRCQLMIAGRPKNFLVFYDRLSGVRH
jgi:hypothetical protein